MSYEVYIDVEHHPKHFDGIEGKKEDWCVRWADDPEDRVGELIAVVNALRDMADEIDPRYICSNCGKSRGEHYTQGGGYFCFNRLGPRAMAKYWHHHETGEPIYPHLTATSTVAAEDQDG